jgi:hypothetical protein
MYAASRPPAWHRDVIWTAGLVLVAAALTTAAALAWGRLSDADTARPLLERTLQMTLLPGAGAVEASALAVRAESGIAPGEPFEALPGSGVRIDPTELAGFDVAAALDRLAGVWSEALVSEGRQALLAVLDDPALAEQLQRVVDGPATGLLEAHLAEELMASGLDDGSRLANWPLQAERNPGEPVQPVVGVFVFFEADALEGLSERQIGEAVVARLAELTIAEGADAAREAITNVNLSARYEQGLSQARSALHQLFEAVLAGRVDELEARLGEARAVRAGTSDRDPGLTGLLPAAELAGLPPEEANRRIVAALAERAWQDGPDALRPLLAGDPRAQRLEAARPAMAPLTRSAHARALRLAWTAGVLAVLAAALMAAMAQGPGRLARPGAGLLLAAVPGTLLAWGLQRAAAAAAGAELPAGARAEGVLGSLAGLLRHLLARLPEAALQDVLRVHLVLAAVGAALLLAALLLAIGGAVRPRRRGYL